LECASDGGEPEGEPGRCAADLEEAQATFRSVRDLIRTINDYIRHCNKNPWPFQWVASASQIIRKVRKYKENSGNTA
jgi:hypothetical protein